MNSGETRSKAPKLLAFAYGSFLVLLFVAFSSVVVANAAAGVLSYYRTGDTVYMADYAHVYRAGAMACSSDRYHIYDPEVQKAWLDKIAKPYHFDSSLEDQNVPYLFIFAIPFAQLPINMSQIVWDAVTAAMGLGAVCILGKTFGSMSRASLGMVAVGALSSYPGFQNFFTGQFSFLVLFLFSAYFYALLRNRDLISGVALACLFKLQYLPFLLVPVLVGKRFRILLGAVAMGVFLLAVCCALFGVDNVVNYPKILMNMESHGHVSADQMINLRRIFNLFLPQAMALQVSILASLASLAYVVWLWRWPAAVDKRMMERWAISMTVVAALVASPHSFEIDCVLLTISAALSLPTLGFSGEINKLPASFQIYRFSLLSYPVLSWVFFDGQKLIGPNSRLGFMLLNIVILISGTIYLNQLRSTANRASDSTG